MDVGMKWMVIDACQDERDIVILDEPLARRNQSNCARDEAFVWFPLTLGYSQG
jgi:hypothetical protein